MMRLGLGLSDLTKHQVFLLKTKKYVLENSLPKRLLVVTKHKLKKRIILHFRLFCSTFGHLKKKVQNLLKNSENLIFLKFQILICDRNWARIGWRSAQSQSLPQIFFMPNGQKLTNLSQKKHTPQKGPFLGRGREGGR